MCPHCNQEREVKVVDGLGLMLCCPKGSGMIPQASAQEVFEFRSTVARMLEAKDEN